MNVDEEVDVAILGGGVAGLSAAWRLAEQGRTAVVFEAADVAGGLLAGFEVDGFRFDNGVHLSFASEPEVRAVFDRTPTIDHKAESFCWDAGCWLKHPVQNNLYPLPASEKAELIAGLIAQEEREPANYEDWLIGQYGEPIARRWPIAYTEKYWTVPARTLGTDWIGKRMRKADAKEVLFGAMTAETPSTYYISEMRYPRQGGYGAFVSPLAEAADVRTGHKVVGVDLDARIVTFANGRTVRFRALVSTLPLPALTAMTAGVPDNLRAAAETLFASRVDLVSIGLRTTEVAPSVWFYIYDPQVFAARVYSPSMKSPNNAPAGCGSLQFEIYSSARNPNPHSVEDMKENCLQALETMGLARREDVVLVHHKHVPYANVVFDLGMEERRDRIRDWFRDHDVHLAGRFGEWAYLWSNQAFMSGRAAADAVAASGADATAG